VAIEQLVALDQLSERLKVVVADSGFANWLFLSVFLVTKTLAGLVRLRGNQVLYESPPPVTTRQRGRPRLHGPAFRLRQPARPPDRQEAFGLPGGGRVVLAAWQGLHLRLLSELVGTVIRVRVYRPDGRLRHVRPWWLYWTGPTDVALADLFAMYTWRFAIEHAFRFFKQHLGLNAANLVAGQAPEQWMQVCLLAYWQLLLGRQIVTGYLPPWQRQPKTIGPWTYTPRQVQQALAGFMSQIGTPALAPKPSGKGVGRAPGCIPHPRPRYSVIVKGHPAPKVDAPAVA
jgi:hypothetical protein